LPDADDELSADKLSELELFAARDVTMILIVQQKDDVVLVDIKARRGVRSAPIGVTEINSAPSTDDSGRHD
jgi:hypothetical protein